MWAPSHIAWLTVVDHIHYTMDGTDGDGDASCWDTDDDGCTDGCFCQSTPYFLLEGKFSKRKFDSYDL